MPRNKNGQYQYTPFKHSQWSGAILLISIMIVGATLDFVYKPAQSLLSPCPDTGCVMIQVAKVEAEDEVVQTPKYQVDDMSVYISEAVQEFLPKHKSESLMIMHCLAHRENGHAANRNCGDSGKACGPFQFHQPTWEGYRKLMIKEGLATEIGDRYDKKESARTTAWAIAGGRETAWGPISRDIKGSDYATCQAPSWRSK